MGLEIGAPGKVCRCLQSYTVTIGATDKTPRSEELVFIVLVKAKVLVRNLRKLLLIFKLLLALLRISSESAVSLASFSKTSLGIMKQLQVIPTSTN